MAVMAVASVLALQLLTSHEVIPSALRDPLDYFVQPGVTVWWFVLAGPFRSMPQSPGDIVFAAVANAALWWLAFWAITATARAIRR